MSLPVLFPTDDHGNALIRAMGLPIPTDAIPLGGTNYVDLYDLSQFGDRVFIGLSIVNPDASNAIYISMGADFCGTANKVISVPKNSQFTFDEQTFGFGITDQESGVRVKKIRALLSATTGTLSAGSFGYGTSGNPTNGMGVTINGRVYGFYTNTNSPGLNVVPVAIAGTAALTWGNLLTVLNNRTPGAQVNGINYGEQAVVATNSANTLTLTAAYPGAFGQVPIADGGTGVTNTTATVTAMTGGAAGTIPTMHIW
jgi:hypothetical protein